MDTRHGPRLLRAVRIASFALTPRFRSCRKRVPGRCPLFPHDGPKPPANPFVKTPENRWRFAEAEVRPPPEHVRSEFLHHLAQAHTTHPSGQLPDSCSKPDQRLVGESPFRSLAMSKAEAQKRSVPSGRHRTFRRIDFEFQPRRDEERDARHHPVPRSRGADVHIAVVRIPNEAVAATFELAVKRVQHDVRQERGERSPLRGALLRRTDQAVLQDPRIQERAGKLQHACIRHALSQPTHQEVMIHSVEELFEVEVHDPPIAARQDVLARPLPPDVPTAPAETRSCGRRMSGRRWAATPAAPLAGQSGRERWARRVCARHHPAWESRHV